MLSGKKSLMSMVLALLLLCGAALAEESTSGATALTNADYQQIVSTYSIDASIPGYADYLQRYEDAAHPDVTVTARACPLFVPLVENGRYERGDVVIETVAREYLEPIRGSGIDTLILGCTHYPLLTDLIGEIMGPEVTLIDTGEEAAWELKRTLKAKNLLSDCAQEGTTTLYASDQPEDFGSMAKHFLQEELTSPVLQVNIDRY